MVELHLALAFVERGMSKRNSGTLVDTLEIIIFDRRRILKMKRRLLLSEVLIAVSIMSAGLSVSPSVASVILQSHHTTGQNQFVPSLPTKESKFVLFVKSDFSNRIASCSLFQIPSKDKFKSGIQLEKGLIYYPDLWSASKVSPLSAWYLWRGFAFSVIGIDHGYSYIKLATPPTYVYTKILYQGKIISSIENPIAYHDYRIYSLKNDRWYNVSITSVGDMSESSYYSIMLSKS
jgi:hypothetical protein